MRESRREAEAVGDVMTFMVGGEIFGDGDDVAGAWQRYMGVMSKYVFTGTRG